MNAGPERLRPGHPGPGGPDALTTYQSEVEKNLPVEEPRQIPLYRTPAAAGYASPVYGEDFDYIDVTGETPRGAEFAVRIPGAGVRRER